MSSNRRTSVLTIINFPMLLTAAMNTTLDFFKKNEYYPGAGVAFRGTQCCGLLILSYQVVD